ncbi:unnamed protein product [[Candida] boidinii]|nr:unnamed protein product [[Candida] boidinii]
MTNLLSELKDNEYILVGYVPLLNWYNLTPVLTEKIRIIVPLSDAVANNKPSLLNAIAANEVLCASMTDKGCNVLALKIITSPFLTERLLVFVVFPTPETPPTVVPVPASPLVSELPPFIDNDGILLLLLLLLLISTALSIPLPLMSLFELSNKFEFDDIIEFEEFMLLLLFFKLLEFVEFIPVAPTEPIGELFCEEG